MQNQTRESRESLLAERVYFSLVPGEVNYITAEQHALLLDVVHFLTPANVQKYLVNFYQNKDPCCGRTLYIYLTTVLNDPKLAHLAHYRHQGRMVHVLEVYKAAMSSERRRNNDVFGRSVMVQVRLGDRWVAVKLCQIMLCFMVDRLHLFDHIGDFMDDIREAIQQSEQKTTKPLRSSLRKVETKTTDQLDYHLSNQHGWRLGSSSEKNTNLSLQQKGLVRPVRAVRPGIDFYLC